LFRSWDLDLRLEPVSLHGVGDVHVLEADGAAVALTQQSEDAAEGHHRLGAESAGGELAFEVPQGQTVLVDVEIRVRALPVDQGIDRKSTRLNSSHVSISYAV